MVEEQGTSGPSDERAHTTGATAAPAVAQASSALVRVATSAVPTATGKLTLVVYREPIELGFGPEAAGWPWPIGYEKEHVAIVAGDLEALRGAEGVPARVHSECWTGETLGSMKCDCRDQLDRALSAIVSEGRGVVVYLRQEGRGIGLGNKIRAYALQESGADTVEANLELGFAADLRSYELAAAILRDLQVSSVALMTNNPDKLAGLEQAGVHVTARIPHWGDKNVHNEDYLEVKRKKLGHI
jgi:GTP cyclohydrolase II/3,4-dihydroxy 2-butanone 4-phosphate synthase/GTP cyclohydrolase II